MLVLAIDTNFKLLLKEKGIKSDPALGDGWAHWVPREEFYEYLRKHGGEVEVRISKDYHPIYTQLCLLPAQLL